MCNDIIALNTVSTVAFDNFNALILSLARHEQH